MGAFSAVHWLIVLVVLLLVFGPGRLANVGKGLGEGLRNFKKGLDDEPAATDEAEEDAENEEEEEEPELTEGEAAPKLKKKAKA